MTRQQRRPTDFLEVAWGITQTLGLVGAVSGAAFAAAVGQFVLAVVLASIALGVLVRLKRGRLKKDSTKTSP